MSLAELVSSPLIIGASVSADWGAISPGKRLARRIAPLGDIRMFAQGGRQGRDTVARLPQNLLEGRTAILGMDLFFWDSTESDCEAAVTALHDVIARAGKVPLLIGDIPELLPGRQPCRPKLNWAIEHACGAQANCVVFHLDALHRQVLAQGYLEIKGRRYTMSELVPDGLHLSEPAADFLAERMAEALRSLRDPVG